MVCQKGNPNVKGYFSMSQQYDITVIVGTYNPDWTKLKTTLNSIVKQKDINLQIIVSDDGSVNPLHEEIISFFVKIKFSDYKLVAGENNEGTVCQFYRGLCAADAEYVKLISPGDLLYDDTVLSNWLEFTKINNADISFGDAVFYNFKNETLNIVKHCHNPKNMKIYKRPSTYYERVINYLCIRDGISGAAILSKKDVLLYYMRLLLNRVIYVEDYFIYLAVLDERKITYFPSIVIWYEFADGGISTTGDRIWKKRMHKDSITVYDICLEKWAKSDMRIHSWLLEMSEFIKNENPTVSEKLIRYLKHPSWFYWRIYIGLFGEYSPTDVNVSCFYSYYRNS